MNLLVILLILAAVIIGAALMATVGSAHLRRMEKKSPSLHTTSNGRRKDYNRGVMKRG